MEVALIPTLHGNLRGLSPAEKHRLERLYRRRVPPHSILTHELAREMTTISQELNRRVGLLVDRGGRVEAVAVGEAHRLEVPRQPSAPSGRMRFCTLRFLATKFDDEEPSAADLAPLALHRLDAMALIAVVGSGVPGPVRVAHLLPAPERLTRGGRVESGADEERARPPRGAVLPRRRGRNGRKRS